MVEACATYKNHRFPIEIVAHAVWLYYRFGLSLRDVEEMLLERGIVVSYETIRRWGKKHSPDYARRLRRKAPSKDDVWHLDEVAGHRKVNRRLMKMCEHGPCQKLLVIRFIVATAFPPRSLRTRYGSTFAFRSACAWLRTCWRPAASSSRIRPFEAGRRNSGGISPGRSSDGQPAAWATNGISTNVWWPSMARSSGSGVPSIRTAWSSKCWCKAAEMPRRQSV
ncbi:transposase [Mesorhizobium japonicum MAFF 303099]|uniref:Transposase n=1 Tax=Mesorhizobium japonicum (strain LMG 29417 / CECT 9101 / MAFF 303099) TaxID=266835 RepID=Q989N0_RHILO|nr:transposase [Mesorhizobium japonicum MAFF 303099]